MLRWRPPRAVIELAELVVTRALGGWPEPVAVPSEVAEVIAAGAPTLELEDDEGTPVALLSGLRLANARPGGSGGPRSTEHPLISAHLSSAVRPFTHPPLRAERLTPAQVHERLVALGAGPRVLAVAVRSAVPLQDVEHLLEATRGVDAVLWFALIGVGQRHDLGPEALYHGLVALARDFAAPGIVVPLALPVAPPMAPPMNGSQPLGRSPAEANLLPDLAEAYGATQLAVLEPAGPGAVVHPGFEPAWSRRNRAPGERGLTILFTGLAGAGATSLARALSAKLQAQGDRPVTVLDPVATQRLFSAGHGAGRAGRELELHRIGFIAREIARHGGITLCAQVAPFAQARAELREKVEETGDFLLVYLTTPLAECERREGTGLYARARRGDALDVAGVSYPFEAPSDADCELDLTELTAEAGAEALWGLLEERGYLKAVAGS